MLIAIWILTSGRIHDRCKWLLTTDKCDLMRNKYCKRDEGIQNNNLLLKYLVLELLQLPQLSKFNLLFEEELRRRR